MSPLPDHVLAEMRRDEAELAAIPLDAAALELALERTGAKIDGEPHMAQCEAAIRHYLRAVAPPETAGLSAVESQAMVARALNRVVDLRKALRPLVAIADAYDRNSLDEARPEWGRPSDPETVELFTGRGGKRLLTLHDALEARRVAQNLETSK